MGPITLAVSSQKDPPPEVGLSPSFGVRRNLIPTQFKTLDLSLSTYVPALASLLFRKIVLPCFATRTGRSGWAHDNMGEVVSRSVTSCAAAQTRIGFLSGPRG